MKIRKNGKVINLTESDLRRLVKRVLSESEESEIDKMIDDEKIRNLRKANYQNFVNSINDTTVRRSATQIILRKNISKFVRKKKY